MKYLIVNADDFGFTPGVVEGILRAHRDGIVTSTTVLINAPQIEESVKAFSSFPKLKLGLHLNVTWGEPVSDRSGLKTLLGQDGRFIRRSAFEGVNPDEVLVEWKAQVRKARSLGLRLTHLDTHHHTHLNPALLDRLLDLAEKEKLAARSPASWVRDFLKANGIRTPDHFVGDFYGEGKTGPDHLHALLRAIPEGYAELCCHPGIADETLKKISSYHAARESELATLTRPDLRDWLSENGIALTTFQDLPESGGSVDKSCELITPDERG